MALGTELALKDWAKSPVPTVTFFWTGFLLVTRFSHVIAILLCHYVQI